MDTLERSEIPGKFWNVVLGKDGEDQVGWSCEKWRSVTKNQGDEYSTKGGGGLTGLVTSCIGTAFYNMLLKDRRKDRSDRKMKNM